MIDILFLCQVMFRLASVQRCHTQLFLQIILHLSQETDGNMLSGTTVTGFIVVLVTVFVMHF